MPSYLEVQMQQFQQLTVFWRLLSIEKSPFAKSCVFNKFQDAPCFFEQKNQEKHKIFEKLTLSANAYGECDNHSIQKGENAF